MNITEEHQRMTADIVSMIGVEPMADTMGVTPSSVSHWRTGKSGITKGNARKLETLHASVMSNRPMLPLEEPDRIMIDEDSTCGVDLECCRDKYNVVDPIDTIIETAIANPDKMRLRISGREITGIDFV